MPAITVHVDDVNCATIDLSVMDVVSVSVWGALNREELVTVDANGGSYRDGERRFLIWLPDQSVNPGQTVRVQLQETCDGADQGRTIQELYPDAEPAPETDFTITEARAAEIRSRPQLHESFAVHAVTSSGESCTASSDERNDCFSMHVVWDYTRPDKARVSVGTHCLDDVIGRTGGTDHLSTTLSFGDCVSFTVQPE
jgi:hypothetical protein